MNSFMGFSKEGLTKQVELGCRNAHSAEELLARLDPAISNSLMLERKGVLQICETRILR